MSKNCVGSRLVGFAVFIALACGGLAHSAPGKVFIVMSYERDNPWCQEIRAGIDSVLQERYDRHYFYMNTKRDFKGGEAMAQQAYARFLALKPDGVITADDNAQSMFVLPYLKDKHQLPIVFCGVNAAPDAYGYPSQYITGILERNFIRESISMAKQMVPTVTTIGFIARASPSGEAIKAQVEKEVQDYLVEMTGFRLVNTESEAISAAQFFQETSDLLFVGATNGIIGNDGKVWDNQIATQRIAQAYGKPLIGANDFHVRYGVLCAVVKSGQAQGENAAEMMLQALDGTPVHQIPIRRNRFGKRMLNIDVMRALGIPPNRRFIVGTEIVRLEE
ncbi:MAG: ABC transporter substrate binding protein [Desulfosarcinaceae bacterium]|nr:ABC transporter substrate binding protein [Desulfosarcinaceae bacterium]